MNVNLNVVQEIKFSFFRNIFKKIRSVCCWSRQNNIHNLQLSEIISRMTKTYFKMVFRYCISNDPCYAFWEREMNETNTENSMKVLMFQKGRGGNVISLSWRDGVESLRRIWVLEFTSQYLFITTNEEQRVRGREGWKGRTRERGERPAMGICKVSLKQSVTKNQCTYITELSLGNEPHEISRWIFGAHAKPGIVSTSTNRSGKHYNSRESRVVFLSSVTKWAPHKQLLWFHISKHKTRSRWVKCFSSIM